MFRQTHGVGRDKMTTGQMIALIISPIRLFTDCYARKRSPPPVFFKCTNNNETAAGVIP